MLLPFKTRFADGTPTRFPEKIWRSLYAEKWKGGIIDPIVTYMREFPTTEPCLYESGRFDPIASLTPKKHTIRRGNRWSPGANIHFCINNRRPDYYQFAPVVPCRLAQDFAIEWHPLDKGRRCEVIIDGFIYGTGSYDPANGVVTYDLEIEALALNDGFDTVAGFFDWFSEDFDGQIIHWTDLIYSP